MQRGVKLNNNKGFTLIETIVAMSILVLVSVPLMDSISRGMKVSRDTSSFQRAVLLGQSVTEGVRSHSVVDLCSTFVELDEHNNKKYIFDILDRNVYNYIGYGRLALAADGKSFENKSTIDSNSRKYYYGIYGVVSGAKKYDVLIKLDSDEYNDINSKIIPSIVEVGSDSTVVVDNTGVLNHIGDMTLKDMAKSDLGLSPGDLMKCKMEINITKHNADNIVTEGAYHAYGNITYYSVNNISDTIDNCIDSVTYKNVGEDTFDYKNKLKYMYVICNGKDLVGINDIVFNVDVGNLLSDGTDNVDIPVALITSECSTGTNWQVSYDPSCRDNVRQYLSFITNNSSDDNGVSNIYKTDDITIENFGDSGKKIRRIYALNVQVYDYQEDLNDKFKTKPLSNIKSTLIR